jgi:hypothetical protein
MTSAKDREGGPLMVGHVRGDEEERTTVTAQHSRPRPTPIAIAIAIAIPSHLVSSFS